MLQACDQRFDVTENLEKFCELNKALGPCLVLEPFCKMIKISRHIKIAAHV